MILNELQQSMANYLRELGTVTPIPTTSLGPKREACLQIYRNHYLVTLIDAITATFPVTRDFLGEQFFHATVRRYVLANPPVSGCLADYGQDFPDWLYAETPDIYGASDLAALEWCMERVGMMPLPQLFPFQMLAELSPEQYENVHFHLATGVRIFSSNQDVVSLYDQIKDNKVSNEVNAPSTSYDWLIYRQPDGVGIYPIDTFFSEVLNVCQSGQSLSSLENDLSSEHVQAIFFMVEKGIIDSFNLDT